MTNTKEQKQMQADQLKVAAFEADRVFGEALVKRYGERAGDMRYRTLLLPPEIKALAYQYQNAVDAWKREIARFQGRG